MYVIPLRKISMFIFVSFVLTTLLTNVSFALRLGRSQLARGSPADLSPWLNSSWHCTCGVLDADSGRLYNSRDTVNMPSDEQCVL